MYSCTRDGRSAINAPEILLSFYILRHDCVAVSMPGRAAKNLREYIHASLVVFQLKSLDQIHSRLTNRLNPRQPHQSSRNEARQQMMAVKHPGWKRSNTFLLASNSSVFCAKGKKANVQPEVTASPLLSVEEEDLGYCPKSQYRRKQDREMLKEDYGSSSSLIDNIGFKGEDPLHLADTESSRRLSSPSFTVTIDILTVALVSSAALYVVCFRLARHKLKVLHRLQPQMTTKKLLILGVLLVSVLRIMTILGVAAMNMANVRAHYALQPSRHSTGDKTQDFYDEAMTVLFDLPNCIVVSTYILLTLVWAECFLESRFHTEDAMFWKRRLLIFFMIFNCLLYATQLVLYTVRP